MHIIDEAIKNFMNMKFDDKVDPKKDGSIDLYYEMQMT